MKKLVTELKAGDIIDPPAGEKIWLWGDGKKRRYTVTETRKGKTTAKGDFVLISSKCESPYGNDMIIIKCQMLSTKQVSVF